MARSGEDGAAQPAPSVRLRLPVLFEPLIGLTTLDLAGGTVPAVLEAAFARFPELRHHLILDGALRPHVLCFVNRARVAFDEVATRPLASGDEVWIHQAISGG